MLLADPSGFCCAFHLSIFLAYSRKYRLQPPYSLIQHLTSPMRYNTPRSRKIDSFAHFTNLEGRATPPVLARVQVTYFRVVATCPIRYQHHRVPCPADPNRSTHPPAPNDLAQANAPSMVYFSRPVAPRQHQAFLITPRQLSHCFRPHILNPQARGSVSPCRVLLSCAAVDPKDHPLPKEAELQRLVGKPKTPG